MKRRIMAFVIMLSVLFTTLCTPEVVAYAAGITGETVDSGKCGDEVTWELIDSEEEGICLLVDGTGDMWDYDLTTLSTRPWEQYKNDIVNIYIGPKVTTVGDYAFYGCENVVDLFLQNSHVFGFTTVLDKTIGDYALAKCTSFVGITGVYSIKGVGEGAFLGCTEMWGFWADYKLEFIGDYAFADSDISSFEIEKKVGPAPSEFKMGKDVFQNCDNLAMFYLEFDHSELREKNGGLYSLSQKALLKYPPLYGESTCEVARVIGTVDGEEILLETIKKDAISNNLYMTQLVLPDSVKVLEDNSIYGNENLESIVIPSSVTTIGKGIGADCPALESITIPSSVTTIGEGIGANCPALEYIDNQSSVTLTLPEIENAIWVDANENPVTSISNGKAYLINSVKSIQLVGDAQYIGINGYVGDEFEFPIEWEYYNEKAKKTTDDLIFTSSDPSVISIDEAGNVKLLQIGEADITVNAKYGDAEVTCHITSYYKTKREIIASGQCGDNITWELRRDRRDPDDPDWIYEYLAIDGTGDMWDYTLDTLSERPWEAYKEDIVTVEIGPAVERIGDYVFYGCENLEYIRFNDWETFGFENDYYQKIIGQYAFSHCKNLFVLWDSGWIKGLEEGAFSYCDSLNEFIADPGLEFIGDAAFEYSGIRYFTIMYEEGLGPETFEMGEHVFRGCIYTTGFDVGDHMELRVNESGLYSISEKSLIKYPSMLQLEENTIEIPSLAAIIEEKGKEKYIPLEIIKEDAIIRNPWVQHIILPESLKVLEDNSIHGHQWLETITIPFSVTKIGTGIGANCPHLKYIDNQSSAELILPEMEGFVWLDENDNLISSITNGQAYLTPIVQSIDEEDEKRGYIGYKYDLPNSCDYIQNGIWADDDKVLTFESSNPSVATVDKYGKVELLAVGEAVITIKSKYSDLVKTCKITVLEDKVIPNDETGIPDKVLFDYLDWDEDGVLMRSEVQDMTFLRLPNAGVKDLTGIRFLENLDELCLSNYTGELTCVEEKVEDLDGWNAISDISELAMLEKLESLHIANNQITDISALAEISTLSGLEINGNKITDISAIKYMESLNYLDASDNLISDMSPVAGISTDKYGFGSLIILNNNQISKIAGVPDHVRVLELAGNQITDLSPLDGKENLIRLDISHNKVTDISPIGDLSINYFYMAGNEITDISCLDEEVFELDISDNPIKDISVLSVIGFPRMLRMANTQVTDFSFFETGMYLQMEELDLSGNNITDISFLKNKTVENLIIADNQITDLSALENMTELTTLIADNNQIDTLEDICHLTNLEEVSLDYNELTSLSGLESLVSGNVKQWSVSVAHNKITDIAMLSDMNPGELIELDISYNLIEDLSPSKILSLYIDVFTEGNPGFDPKDIIAKTLELDIENATIAIGDTLQLTATVGPENVYNKTVTWISSDPDIAVVDENGKVTGKGMGEVSITARTTDGSYLSASCNLYVYWVFAEDLKLDCTSKSLKVGDTFKINATLEPENVTLKILQWTSKDESVATVDKNGNVTATGVGTTVICVQTIDGGGVYDQYAECTIVVEEAEVIIEDGLHQDADGNWYMYKDGKIDTTYFDLVEHDGEKWYVENGKVDFSINGVVKCGTGAYFFKNGVVQKITSVEKYNNGWWYVKDGQVDFNYNGLGTNKSGTWFIRNGKVDFGVSTVAKCGNGWYYFKGGSVQFIDSVEKNSSGWWYIKNGKVDFSYNGLGTNKSGSWFVKGGKVDFNVNTVAKCGKDWYYFKGGKVQFIDSVEKNSSGWWYIKNGKVDFTYNGLGKNKTGTWFIKGGKVDFNVNTVAKCGKDWYYFKGGKVQFIDSVEKNSSGWWYIKNGKVNFNFKGIASNKSGYWYLEGGKVNFNYTGKYKDNSGKVWKVVQGKATK